MAALKCKYYMIPFLIMLDIFFWLFACFNILHSRATWRFRYIQVHAFLNMTCSVVNVRTVNEKPFFLDGESQGQKNKNQGKLHGDVEHCDLDLRCS